MLADSTSIVIAGSELVNGIGSGSDSSKPINAMIPQCTSRAARQRIHPDARGRTPCSIHRSARKPPPRRNSRNPAGNNRSPIDRGTHAGLPHANRHASKAITGPRIELTPINGIGEMNGRLSNMINRYAPRPPVRTITSFTVSAAPPPESSNRSLRHFDNGCALIGGIF